MPKRRARRSSFVLGSLALFVVTWARSATPAAEVFVVEDGVARDAVQRDGDWKAGDGYLEGAGVGKVLEARLVAGSGEVHVRARLSLERLGHTAATLVLGESHFGLDGAEGRLFVEGPLFGGTTRYLSSEDSAPVLREGVPFSLEARRRGRRLEIRIDGRTVHEQEVGEEPLGRIGLRPWRSTMRVRSFSVSGDLVEPPRLPEPVDVWTSGEGGYHTYRIPAIVAAPSGALLAFCEGRRSSRSDTGDIDVLVRRSEDGGRTWSKQSVVWDDGPNVCGNPCPVVDRSTGTVWLLLTWNRGDDHEGDILTGKSRDVRRIFVTSSRDDGRTWEEPREISATTRLDDWRWYATGPGNAIQLRHGAHAGRLLVPANHSTPADSRTSDSYRSHVIWSDDHGKTWQLGGVHEPRTNESAVVELADGRVLQNMRSYHGKGLRAVATSSDGGASWSKTRHDEALVEPVCQASLVRYSFPTAGRRGRVLFSNPAASSRRRMTVRLSYDDCATWPVEKVVYPGSAAYSCLVVLPDGEIGLLFERDDYRRISFLRFDLDWLTDGADRGDPDAKR